MIKKDLQCIMTTKAVSRSRQYIRYIEQITENSEQMNVFNEQLTDATRVDVQHYSDPFGKHIFLKQMLQT